MMENEKDEIIIKNLKGSLDSVDKINVKTPDMGFFRKMVAEAEEKKIKKRKKETIIFALSAIGILSVETFAFNQSAVFFIIIQIAALLSVPAALFYIFRQKKGHEGAV